MQPDRPLEKVEPPRDEVSLPIDVASLLRELKVLEPEAGTDTADGHAADTFLAHLQETEARRAFVTRLFPNGIPVSGDFFDRIEQVRVEFDPSGSCEEAFGLLWSEAVGGLSPSDAQTLLTLCVRRPSHTLFDHLSSLNAVLRDHPFPSSFLAPWFAELVRAVERDGFQGGAWAAIRVVCEQHVGTALEVLRALATTQDETRLNVAAFMLGVMRNTAQGEHSLALQEIESLVRDHEVARIRAVYYWSRVTTVLDRALTVDELNSLLARADRGPEDRDALIRVSCRLLAVGGVTPEAANQCREWVGAQLSPATTPESKDAAVRTAHAIEFPRAGADAATVCLSEWILAVQPVPREHVGTWQAIGHYLCELLKQSRDKFAELFLRLATSGAPTLQYLLRERHLSRLHRDMQAAGLDELVGGLCISRDTGVRRLGIFLFDSLELTKFPASVLTADPDACRLLFYESQRVLLAPRSIARILSAVATHADGGGAEFAEDVLEELRVQIQNFAGECQDELRALGGAIPLVSRALQETATYFSEAERVHKAGLNAMEVPGHRKAAIAHHRRFSKMVAKGAESHSVLLSLVKKTKLLYGRTTATFVEGRLGAAQPLIESSVSVPLPLIDFCDPEDMALRRLHASRVLEELTTADDNPHGPTEVPHDE